MGQPPFHAHLSTPAAAALGRPDCILVVSDVRFPAHRSFLTACCSILGELFQEGEYAGAQELVLFPAAPAATAPGTPRQDGPASASSSGSSEASTASGPARQRRGLGMPGPAQQWVTSPVSFAVFLHRLYDSARGACRPADEEEARMLVHAADFWGALSLLPACDAFLAMHLRMHPTAVLDGVAQPQGYKYSVSAERLRRYVELASRHGLRRLMAECCPFLWELPRDEAAPLLSCLDGPVTAAICSFMFSRKQQYQEPAGPGSCGCRECGPVQHIKFDAPVGTGTFAHRCLECKLRIRSQRRMMADEVEESLSQQGWGCS